MIVIPSISSSSPLRPVCGVCSARWQQRMSSAIGIVPVERATIMREHPGRGYLAVVGCSHGGTVEEQTAIVEFGADTPRDERIRSTVVFRVKYPEEVFS